MFGLKKKKTTMQKIGGGLKKVAKSKYTGQFVASTAGATAAIMLTGNDKVLLPSVKAMYSTALGWFSSSEEGAPEKNVGNVQEWFPVVAEIAKANDGDLSQATKEQLRTIARAVKITGYGSMKKDEILAAVKEFMAENGAKVGATAEPADSSVDEVAVAA